MNLYPVMINLEDRLVTVIGAGEVSLRKVEDLLETGARVRVISPVFHSGFKALGENFPGRIECLEREYREGDLDGAALVFSATNDGGVNASVFTEATERNILINAVDDPPNCSFFIPSFIRRGDLLMALSTSGASPSMAARLRRSLESHIPENIEGVLASLRAARELLKNDDAFGGMDFEKRGAILKKVVNDDGLLESLGSAHTAGRLRKFLISLA